MNLKYVICVHNYSIFMPFKCQKFKTDKRALELAFMEK